MIIVQWLETREYLSGCYRGGLTWTYDREEAMSFPTQALFRRWERAMDAVIPGLTDKDKGPYEVGTEIRFLKVKQ